MENLDLMERNAGEAVYHQSRQQCQQYGQVSGGYMNPAYAEQPRQQSNVSQSPETDREKYDRWKD